MRLSLTFSRYLGRHFLNAFAGVLAVMMGLILLFDLIELFRRTASRPEGDAAIVVTMALFKLPQMLHVVLPFAVMVGAMVAFWRLTRSHELVVARAAGVSVWQLLMPVLGLVLLLGVLEVTVFNPVAAALYSQYEQLQDRLLMRLSNPLTFNQNGLWLRENHGDELAVVHAGQVRQEGVELRLSDISIMLFDAGGDEFRSRMDAAHGVLADGVFDLQKVWAMEPGRPSVFLETYRMPTTLTLSTIQDNFASPESLSFWQLPEYIRFFEGSGFSAHRQKLYWQSLLASPLLLCAMVLIAAVFGLRPNMRGGGLMGRIVGGIAAGFLLYFFSRVVYALGLSATLPLVLAAWSPAAVAGLMGLASLFHLEDG